MCVCVCVCMLSYQGGELNMVKISQDHFHAILSIFHFLAMLSSPLPVTQHGILFFLIFPKLAKKLSWQIFSMLSSPPPYELNMGWLAELKMVCLNCQAEVPPILCKQ